MKKIVASICLLAAFAFMLTAQVVKPVKWQVSYKKVSEGVYDIVAKATVSSGWHLYDSELPKDGPLPTTFNIDDEESTGVEKVGKFTADVKPKIEKSEAFGMDLKYYEGTVTFTQRVKLTSDKAKLVGYIEYMACSGGQCVPPSEEEFEFELTK